MLREGSQAHASPPPTSGLPLPLSTFHPEVELSQLCLQLTLQQTHALRGGGQAGTGEGQPSVHSPIPGASASWAPVPHLCVLSMPASGLGQAVPGLTAPWGPGGVGTDHVVGTIPETPLDTVCLIELVDLGR